MAPAHSTYDANGRKVYGVFDQQGAELRTSEAIVPNKSVDMRRIGDGDVSHADSYSFRSREGNPNNSFNEYNNTNSNSVSRDSSFNQLQPLTTDNFQDVEAAYPGQANYEDGQGYGGQGYGDDGQDYDNGQGGYDDNGQAYGDQIVDDIFDDEGRGKNPKKKSKTRRKILILLSLLFLGGMAGLTYYLFQVVTGDDEKSGEIPNEAPAEGNTPTGAPGGSPPDNSGDGLTPQSNNSTDNLSDGTLDNDEGFIPTIPPPPVNLTMTCSKESIVEDNFNLFRCESFCRDSSCCYVKGNDTELDPCIEGNEDECSLYSPDCDFIYGPLDIEARSSSTNSSDLETTNVTAIPQAPDNLTSICDSSTGGSSTECFDACFAGYCCFSSAADIMAGANTTIPSCYDRDVCEGYIPCLFGIIASITPPTNSSFVPTPSDDLPELCSDDSMASQDGAVGCLSQCSQALCCIDLNPATSCIAENIGVCTKYSPCSRILEHVSAGSTDENSSGSNTTDSNSTDMGVDEPIGIPPPPENLSEICDRDTFEGSPGKLKQCAVACDAALCCFHDGDSSCLQDNLALCLEYAPCQMLVGMIDASGDVPFPPSDLEERCGDESLSTEAGRVECMRGCVAGICCLHPYDQCFSDNAFSCLRYDPCEAVFDVAKGGFNGIVPLLNSTGGPGADIDVPLPSLNIADTCSENNVLSSQEGVAACFGICADSACCTSDEGNCYASNPGACDSYKDCLNLLFLPTAPPVTVDDSEYEPPPDNLESICASDVAFSKPDCDLSCAAASCCYSTGNSSCLAELSDWCALFAPCLVLFSLDDDNSTNSTSNSTVLERACNSTAQGSDPDECADLCVDGSCCLLDPSQNASCSGNANYCDYYSPCSLVYGDGSQDLNMTFNSTANFTLLVEICDTDKVLNSTDAKESCADVCIDGECCLLDASNEDSCLNRIEFCEVYSPCLALLTTPLGNDTISIKDVCHPDIIDSSNSSVLDCEMLCSAGFCCFPADDDVDNCANDTSFCQFYEACEILFVFSNGTTSIIPSESPSSSSMPSTSTYPTIAASSVIDEACRNVEQEPTNADAFLSCIDLCTEGVCCFIDEPNDASCINEEDFCKYYLPCSALFDTDESPPDDPPSLNATDSSLDPSTNRTDTTFDGDLTDAALVNLTDAEVITLLNQTTAELDGLLNMTDADADAFLNGTGDAIDAPFNLTADDFSTGGLDPDPVVDPPEPAMQDPQDVVDTPN
jgi:hypothetical protein